jgi:hypothetical protein
MFFFYSFSRRIYIGRQLTFFVTTKFAHYYMHFCRFVFVFVFRYFFPSLSKSPSSITEKDVAKATDYNKLITNHECILGEIVRKPNQPTHTRAYVRAGPRRELHFDPVNVNAAIVTCGGLCPGLNNVVREIVNTLCSAYGISGKVWGIQGGFRGFWDFEHYRPVPLTPELVANIHHEGGTVLGSSRGGFDLEKILQFLMSKKITCLFVIGGDGTHRGAFRKSHPFLPFYFILFYFTLLYFTLLYFTEICIINLLQLFCFVLF